MNLAGVAQTAVLTLRARADEHRRADRVFEDPTAVEWTDRLPWPSALDEWYADGAQNNIALRVADIDHILRQLAETESVSSIVELGCGLSTRDVRLRHLGATWTGVDLSPVIDLRRTWGAAGRHVARSVLDPTWPDEVGPGPHVFVAEGLLYYLPRAEVDATLARMRRAYAGSVLVMDVLGRSDYPNLHRRTAALGVPVAWHLDRPFDEALEDFGLAPIDGFSPDRLAKTALARYLPRLHPALKMMSWWALHAGLLPPDRSGNVVGRLSP